MMDWRETVSVAIDALRANKVRAMLTSLGVIIGSASIVLVVTVALTSKKFVLSQIESVGSNLVWVEMVQRQDRPQPLSYELTLDDLEAVKAIPNVIEVAGTRELPMTLVVRGVERPVNLVGVTEGYQTIRRLLILRGRYFDASDMEMRSKVCLITTQLSDRVFGQENPIGRNIRLGELTFTVIGVFRERVETFGLSDIQENSVIIPFTLMKYYTGMEVVRLLDAQAAKAEDVASVDRQVGQLLRSRLLRDQPLQRGVILLQPVALRLHLCQVARDPRRFIRPPAGLCRARIILCAQKLGPRLRRLRRYILHVQLQQQLPLLHRLPFRRVHFLHKRVQLRAHHERLNRLHFSVAADGGN